MSPYTIYIHCQSPSMTDKCTGCAGGTWVGDLRAYSNRNVDAVDNSSLLQNVVAQFDIVCWGGADRPPQGDNQSFSLVKPKVFP